jgi:hypothetical protein
MQPRMKWISLATISVKGMGRDLSLSNKSRSPASIRKQRSGRHFKLNEKATRDYLLRLGEY